MNKCLCNQCRNQIGCPNALNTSKFLKFCLPYLTRNFLLWIKPPGLMGYDSRPTPINKVEEML